MRPVYIVGATASGKSELAFRLAKELNGEIVSADSMQIYRGLDIGTAKESIDRRKEIAHSMIDIVDFTQSFSVAEYAEQAKTAIMRAISRGKLPIVVGGTGLYFESLIYPMSFASAPKDDRLRDKLNEELKCYGAEYLHDKLKALDCESAEKLHPNDTKRVIRALEIVLTTGKTRRENADIKAKGGENVLMAGLSYSDRGALYERINKRVDSMFALGLPLEITNLLLNSDEPAEKVFSYQSMQAIGYKEFAPLMLSSDYLKDFNHAAERLHMQNDCGQSTESDEQNDCGQSTEADEQNDCGQFTEKAMLFSNVENSKRQNTAVKVCSGKASLMTADNGLKSAYEKISAKYAEQLNAVKEQIKQNTRNYAKRQLTWFKKYPFVKWFEPEQIDKAVAFIKQSLTK
jgi:tRNA dimethylallyltransferase